MSSWTKFRDKIAKPVAGAVAGFVLSGFNPAGAVAGYSAVKAYDSARDASKDAKSAAKQAAADREKALTEEQRAMRLQEDRFAAEQKHLAEQKERYDSIYAPIEQQMAADIGQGPNLQQAAGIAGGNFANEYDAAIDARSRDEMRGGYTPRAGSSALRMQGENDAYNRARGVATAQTGARREEDDAHFLKANAFYQNGTGIQSQLLQGMQTMYGADYDAAIGQSQRSNASADQNQAFSVALNKQKNESYQSIADMGVRMYTGGLGAGGSTGGSTGTNALTTDVSDSYVYSGAAKIGSSDSGAIPANLYSDGVNYQTPKANQYMNDGSTPANQTQAAIAGSNRALINQYG